MSRIFLCFHQASLSLLFLAFTEQLFSSEAQTPNLRATSPAPDEGEGIDEERLIREILTVVGGVSAPIILCACIGLIRYRRKLVQMMPVINRGATDQERAFFFKAEQAKVQELKDAAEAELPPEPVIVEPKNELAPLSDVEAFFRSDDEDDRRLVFGLSSKASSSTGSLGGRHDGLEETSSRRGGSKASSSKAMAGPAHVLPRSPSEISEGSLDGAAVHPDPGSSHPKDFLRPPDVDGHVPRKARGASKQSTGSRKEGGGRSVSKGSSHRSASKGSARSGSKEIPPEGGIRRHKKRLLTH